MLRPLGDKFKTLSIYADKIPRKKKSKRKGQREVLKNNESELPRIEGSSQVEGVYRDPSRKRKINYGQKNHSIIAEYQIRREKLRSPERNMK